MEREKPRKQRRKKSKGHKVKVTSSAPPPLPTYKKPTAIPKQDFVQEENEIQKIIKENLEQKPDHLRPIDLEIMFFENGIPVKEEDTQEEKDTASIKTNESIKTVSNMPESPAHMASSYLVVEEMSVIEKLSNEVVEYDEKLLYFPNLEEEPELETELKVLKTEVPEDGLFQHFNPKVLDMNRAQMINRCLEEANLSGLKMIENGPSIFDVPFEFAKNRHLFKSHSGKKFHPILVKAEPMSKTFGLYETMNKTLNIFIHSIIFDQHPNLSENLLLIKKIKQLYERYVYTNEHDEVKRLKSKLEGLRYVKEQMTNDDSKLEMCKLQIKKTRDEFYKKSKQRKELILQILESWRHLKQLEGGQVLDFALIIHCTDVDPEEDRSQWEEKFQVALSEVLEERFEEYLKLKQEHKMLSKSKTGDAKLEKPIKPDVEAIKEHLLSMWLESFRQPGDPKTRIELETATEGTKPIPIGLKYLIKIYADNELVTTTKPKELLHDFNIQFEFSFAIKLTTHMLKDLRIEIMEITDIKVSHKVTEIYAILPSSTDEFAEMDFNEYEFSSKKIRGHRIHGRIILKCGWAVVDPNLDKEASTQDLHLGRKSVISKDTIKTWHQQHLIDPLDPDSHSALNIQHEYPLYAEQRSIEKKFDLNEEELCFCSQEEMDSDERLNMLRARFERDLKFKGTTFVPSDQKELEIPDNANVFEEIVGDPIDIQRHEGKKYLKKVYETITNHCENLNASREDAAILIGDQVPTFGSLSLTFLEIFGAKRPLKPTRRTPSSSKSGRTLDLQDNFSIVVTIVRAFGVPQRDEDLDLSRRNSNLSVTNKTIKGPNVRPFVSISVKDKSVRTCTAEGFNPTWNEQLAIAVNSKSGLNKSILSVDLFDECIEDYMSDDRRITEVYQRWLGQLQFPLETIYQNQRIEGTFEMNTPALLLGYNRQNFDTAETSATLNNVGLPNMREVTYLSLFINLEPIIDVPRPLITIGLESMELEDTKLYIDTWFIDLKNEFSWTTQSPYVVLQNGKKSCITRLLGTLEVPPFESLVAQDSLEEYVRRFVSLIPIYSSFNQCIGLDGVWLTNDQIFNMVCASPKDLGVLLTCYYLTQKLEAWLILGQAIPLGDTCFVLLKEENEYFIVDPTTGKKYESTAVDCPLKKVYSLVNAENYWANIQKEKRVFMTLFEVRSSTEWRPLFKASHKAPTGFLHNGAFQFRRSYNTADLQRTIELKLTKKINSWRTHRKTIWNRYVTEHLRKILVELENETVFGQYNTDKHLQQLSRLFNNYKVTGFPLNFRYTNLSAIVHHVKCTGIHLNPENAEFSLAVYIKEFASNIFSVWIFLASLVSKM